MHKIDRSDTDFNTIQWQEDYISIAPHSNTTVMVSRHKYRLSEPIWTLPLDVTSGHRMLRVAYGNRLAQVGKQHLLAITNGEHENGGVHNYQLHYIHEDGQVLWSRPWQTIQRFTMVQDKLLVVRYVNPPTFWIQSVPLEAHLLDPETGESVDFRPISIPLELLPYYQSWQVTKLKTYLVWKNDQLVVTVRPHFRPQYEAAHTLKNRGAFKQTLTFN
ncbi:MAG: hypothetical protein ACPG8W_16265 [Candidatus Promineifilaceae bacterium]